MAPNDQIANGGRDGAVVAPRVCIVLATYKPNVEFLRKQIESICEQTYSNWTCVIQDDASSEESQQTLSSVIGEDSRFQLEANTERLGAYHTFERGLSRVPHEASYVCFCDQDDIWRNDKLAILVDLIARSNAALVHSDLSIIDENGQTLQPSCWKWEGRTIGGETFPLLLLMNNVTGCAAMFDRRLLDIALPFPVQATPEGFLHDWWLAVLAIERGGIAAAREPLVAYRRHSENAVGAIRRPGAIEEGWRLLANLLSSRARSTLSTCVYLWRLRSELEQFARERLASQGISVGRRVLPDCVDFGLSTMVLSFKAFVRGYRGPRAMLVVGKFLRDLMLIRDGIFRRK